MSEKYTLREVRVEILPGVYLIADVTSLDGLSQLLADLKNASLLTPQPPKKQEGKKEQEQKVITPFDDTPAGKIETNAQIPAGSLLSKNVLAFKDDLPQFLRPSAFKAATEAALVLIHAVETGLKTTFIDYDSFKGLYESQNIKSGTPLPMLLTNLRNSGYLDKKMYKDGRQLRLTPKGDKRAIEILREFTTTAK